MCLAVPGKIVKLLQNDDQNAVAKTALIDFHGSRVEVSLALVPDAELGAWVLVHAGYAIQTIDILEARKTWDWLHAAELVEEMHPDLANVEVPSESSSDEAGLGK